MPLACRLMADTGPQTGSLNMESPVGLQNDQANGQASRLPKISGNRPPRKSSVSLFNDADLEGNIKDQLAAVSISPPGAPMQASQQTQGKIKVESAGIPCTKCTHASISKFRVSRLLLNCSIRSGQLSTISNGSLAWPSWLAASKHFAKIQ